jgi:ribosome-associated protein
MVAFDVREESAITDYYIVASGMSGPHVKALYGAVLHQLKQDHIPCYRRSGVADAGWMVLDYVDVIIHIFLPEAREFYDIESLWDQADRIA